MRPHALVSLLVFACSSEPRYISYTPPLSESETAGEAGSPSEPQGSGGNVTPGMIPPVAGESGSAAIGAYGGSGGSQAGSSGAGGSAGLAGSAGTSGMAGLAGMGGSSAGQAGAPMGGAGSSGGSGSMSGSGGSTSGSAGMTDGEAGMAGSPDEPQEPRCRVRRMPPNDDQCLVQAIEGCPDVGLLIAPPGTCVWTSQQSDHDGCDSPSTFRSCQRLCAKDEPVSMVISFRNHLSAKIYLYNGRSPVCWDIPTQAFGAPCDEQCDEAAQKHEAYACHDVNCIENWSFAPSCDAPIPVGDDQNSCR